MKRLPLFAILLLAVLAPFAAADAHADVPDLTVSHVPTYDAETA